MFKRNDRVKYTFDYFDRHGLKYTLLYGKVTEVQCDPDFVTILWDGALSGAEQFWASDVELVPGGNELCETAEKYAAGLATQTDLYEVARRFEKKK